MHATNTYTQTNLQKKYHKLHSCLTTIKHIYNIEAIITTTAATRPSHHTNTARQTGRDTYQQTHSVRSMWRSWEKQKNISIKSKKLKWYMIHPYMHACILTYIHTTTNDKNLHTYSTYIRASYLRTLLTIERFQKAIYTTNITNALKITTSMQTHIHTL